VVAYGRKSGHLKEQNGRVTLPSGTSTQMPVLQNLPGGAEGMLDTMAELLGMLTVADIIVLERKLAW
jgi:hypothetical protein